MRLWRWILAALGPPAEETFRCSCGFYVVVLIPYGDHRDYTLVCTCGRDTQFRRSAASVPTNPHQFLE